MEILEIRFSLLPRDCCCLLKAVAIYWFSNFSKLFARTTFLAICSIISTSVTDITEFFKCLNSINKKRRKCFVSLVLSTESSHADLSVRFQWDQKTHPRFWRARSLLPTLGSVNWVKNSATISIATCYRAGEGHCRRFVKCQDSLKFICLCFKSRTPLDSVLKPSDLIAFANSSLVSMVDLIFGSPYYAIFYDPLGNMYYVFDIIIKNCTLIMFFKSDYFYSFNSLNFIHIPQFSCPHL